MAKVLIIGAGGVGTVVAHKVMKVPQVFSDILLASRTKSKCDTIAEAVGSRKIKTAQVDADDVRQLVELFESFKPEIVINVALPYQDLTIMEACLETGVSYLDTAIMNHPISPNSNTNGNGHTTIGSKRQGSQRFLGCGFDPGVTGVFTAHASKHHFDEIHYLDIVDCNAGDHGKPFATNFNPEINIREVTQKWEILGK